MKHRLLTVIAFLAFAAAACRADTSHTFSLDTASWEIKPKTVAVAGDFNGWKADATPLKKAGNVWSAAVKLSDGTHAYKFVVDGQRWIQDPKADASLDVEDGNGGKNSAVVISATAAKSDAAAAGILFSIDTSSWDQKPTSINVAGDFNGWKADATPLKKNGNVWSARVPVPAGQHAYKFVVDGQRWIQDPKADAALDSDDGNGGKNSGVIAGPAAAKPKAAPGFLFSLDTSTWDQKPTSVNLAGDFNGWSKDALPMHKDGNVWSVRAPVTEGLHGYKFVVDGQRWIQDPKSDKSLDSDDGNGGMNSGVVVGPDARTLPPPKPNAINTDALLFDDTQVADFNVVDDHELRVRLRVQSHDAEHVYVVVSDALSMDGGQKSELNKLGTMLGYDTYGGLVTVPDAMAGKSIHYGFELTDGTADVMWAGKDLKSRAVTLTPAFTTPAWADHAVWYQIFPERFKNGDPSNDPDNGPSTHLCRWTSKWFGIQPGEDASRGHMYYDGPGTVYDRRYGGDIQGVQQSLPYLKSLGINAIYLNPVFEAASMHKYDATDYRHIDNHFGVKGDYPVAGETEDRATWKWSPSDRIFLDFVKEAHKQGFKVVVDGVFNHVGRPCPFFQDVLEKGKNSKYADWFEITDFGDPANWHKMDDPYKVHGKPGGIQWNAWDGKNGSLPNWKKDNVTGIVRGPLEFINGITKRWLAPDGDASAGIDGFRLDAAEQVPHPFWVQWRKVVKDAKPDAYITGEIWNPAQPWINDGKQFDAVMNYQFAMPTVSFFADTKKPAAPSAFLKRLGEIDYMYPEQSSRVMMNLFDSHDTDRVASMFVNPDRPYDAGNRMQDPDGKNYNARKPNDVERQKMMLAVACQMTFLGAPMIYYGDEAGMWSPDDPSDRQPMTWPGMKFDDPEVGFNQTIFDQYQKLIAIRAGSSALQDGDFFPVTANDADGTLVYGRRSKDQTVYVALNRSPSPHLVRLALPAPDSGKPLLDSVTGKTINSDTVGPGTGTSVQLPPYGFAILSAKP